MWYHTSTMQNSYYNGKTVLVTGAAGFIGSHLVDALLKEGATVYGVDNFITGRKENLKDAFTSSSFTFIEEDAINSPENYLPDAFSMNTKLDVVFHMASPASPPTYQEHPVETYLINTLGTHNILQYLLTMHSACRFVYTSTSEVYGDPKEHPQKESYWGNVNPNGIRSCYDESKRMGETICGVHARDFGLDVRIARIFNTYGPRINLNDGRVIPNFFKQAVKKQPLTIYGDGTQTRSFCYVSDLVSGLLLLGSVDDAKGETINLGNPTEKSILEMAQLINTLMKNTETIEFKPLPGDDPKQRKPDISKAQTILGWSPKVSLEQGLQDMALYTIEQI